MKRITHSKTTIHYATQSSIADLVCADLESRFGGKTETFPVDGSEYHIDFGGMILMSEAPIKCQGTNFSFNAHQFQTLLTKVRRGLDNVRTGNYVKIHGYLSSICMSLEEASALKAFLESNYDELNSLQNSYLDKINKARAQLVSDEVLVAEPPDENIV